jgi:hypothetical protein
MTKLALGKADCERTQLTQPTQSAFARSPTLVRNVCLVSTTGEVLACSMLL